MTACPTEHAEAAMFMRAVRGHEHIHPELELLYAIPNGGKRSRKTATGLKAEGVRAGVPDYHLPVTRAGCLGLWIELKRMRGGAVASSQREWHTRLREQGHCVVVARGWEEAWSAVCAYLAAKP
jgi:hypothetical protein